MDVSTLVALGLVILVVSMLAAYQMGYAAGAKDGYGRGHADGKKDGVARAYAVGFDRGRRAGREKEAEAAAAAAEPPAPESRWRSLWLLAIVALLALLAFVAMMARLSREQPDTSWAPPPADSSRPASRGSSVSSSGAAMENRCRWMVAGGGGERRSERAG